MTRHRAASASTRKVLNCLIEIPEKSKYGYAMMKKTRLKSGTLYPILMRLKERGYLQADWEASDHPGRPPRQRYMLTPKGRLYAREVLLENTFIQSKLREADI